MGHTIRLVLGISVFGFIFLTNETTAFAANSILWGVKGENWQKPNSIEPSLKNKDILRDYTKGLGIEGKNVKKLNHPIAKMAQQDCGLVANNPNFFNDSELKNCIGQVMAMGPNAGDILFEAGTYHFDDLIVIPETAKGIGLRGVDKKQVILFFHTSTWQSKTYQESNALYGYTVNPQRCADGKIALINIGSINTSSFNSQGTQVAVLTQPIDETGRTIHVSDTAGFSIGGFYAIKLDETNELLHSIRNGSSIGTQGLYNNEHFLFIEVVAKDAADSTITVKRPVGLSVDPAWPGIESIHERRVTPDHIVLSDFTIGTARTIYRGHNNNPAVGTNEEHGWNGIKVHGATNTLISNIDMYHVDNGINFFSGSWRSRADNILINNPSQGSQGKDPTGHYALHASTTSSDIIFTNSVIADKFVHSLAVTGKANHVILSNIREYGQGIDTHKSYSYRFLLTEIYSNYFDLFGGGGGAGSNNHPRYAKDIDVWGYFYLTGEPRHVTASSQLNDQSSVIVSSNQNNLNPPLIWKEFVDQSGSSLSPKNILKAQENLQKPLNTTQQAAPGMTLIESVQEEELVQSQPLTSEEAHQYFVPSCGLITSETSSKAWLFLTLVFVFTLAIRQSTLPYQD